MKIVLHRLKSNHLYTEGCLIVNDRKAVPYTIEHTLTMLPVGEYRIRLTKDKKRRRVIGIHQVTPHKGRARGGLYYFEAGHSYLSSKRHRSIVIGEPLIPGAVKKGRPHYDRLFDRIEKCEQRAETITLLVRESACVPSQPSAYWQA